MTPPAAPPSPSAEVRLDELGELIAGLPGLLGFPPVDSLVVVTFTTTPDRCWLGPTVRVDLPEPGGRPDLVEQLCGAFAQNQVVAATPVIVGGGGADPPRLPHRGLMRLLTHELSAMGIRLVHSAWVPTIEHGATWWCYEDGECTGQVHDPRSSALAAVAALDGTVTYGSRAEMVDLLSPDQEDRVAHRAQLLSALTGAPLREGELHQEMLATIDAFTAQDNQPELDDERIVRLTVALGHGRVRDTCLTLSITDRASAAERLWTVLTRAVPAPERAEPAFLLALCAYLRGSAVLAGMSLEVALDADPSHPLASLLRDALDRGTPPAEVRRMVAASVEQAQSRRRPEG
ncbi:DUF4192 domain-containing protein [Actinophytocola xanthii]|uniref:DUF4192 domain-containing protein n=1 Tax=Actinophytocola xanthii TaxID=1912961 RepID=A0A1Q8CR99_9PSEU|nr:DUF4192 domain-containing protein [Actinophytocola xanthii]OLF16891.1 hypothetical protein BU204_14405 [Actinophytocola xanthii]